MKSTHYYKLFNKEECHFEFQYKDGLNIDNVSFNTDPKYECGKGGLYFSDAANIMTFIDYDLVYIREVKVPRGYKIIHIASKTKYRAHALNLLEKHKLSDVKTWQWMLDQKIDINDNNYAIRWACAHGHLSVVKFLVEYDANVIAGDNYAITWASRNGHLSVVKFLVEHGANVTADHNFAIAWASENGHADVVEYLKSKGAVVEYLSSKGATL